MFIASGVTRRRASAAQASAAAEATARKRQLLKPKETAKDLEADDAAVPIA